MFEKNKSTSVKDMLLNKVSEQTSFPLELIEKVISFQGEDILKAIKEHTEIEISGFGVLSISKAKVNNRLIRYSDKLDRVRGEDPKYDEQMEEIIGFLKEKKCQNSENI